MSHTFVAGGAIAEPEAPDDVEIMALLNDDPETRLWQLIRELWEFGERYQEIAEKARRLETQLADPSLRNHPKAGEARERLGRWQAELNHLDAEARLVMHWFTAVWRTVPERRRRELQREPAFPRPKTEARLAGELWVMAKTGRPNPDPVPF